MIYEDMHTPHRNALGVGFSRPLNFLHSSRQGLGLKGVGVQVSDNTYFHQLMKPEPPRLHVSYIF